MPVLVLFGLGLWWFSFRRVGVVANLEKAAAAFGKLSPMGLELPDPGVKITPEWARGVAEAAERIAEQQRVAIAERAKRRRALQAVQQIRRGVEQVRSIAAASVDEVHEINEVGAEAGVGPLEIPLEEAVNAAVRRLRQVNDAADAI
ncbi:MAG: hypothetical protein HYU04_00365 [Candidatus Wildermuthbacteria bacterium]|nr:hypothetical protein [Candidatus Wildermuthbacteria bacterium]